ncbi:MAG: Holliday junction resolvase RuvX [Gammaproteobacteria bacterium]
MTGSLTLIGFDYGELRIGVAVGQTLTGTATPLETVAVVNGKPDWSRIDAILAEWKPGALLVGDPLNMDGTSQYMTEAANAFAATLAKRYKLPVYREDERLSTWEAKERLKDTRNLDPIAAQAILETWLSEHAGAAVDDTIPSASGGTESQ